MLTGRHVFEGATALRTMVDHVEATPEPPSTRAEVPVPEELDRVILQCLAKDPNRRPQTAEELERMLDQVPCGSRWTPERAHAWWDMHQPERAKDPLPHTRDLMGGVTLIRRSGA